MKLLAITLITGVITLITEAITLITEAITLITVAIIFETELITCIRRKQRQYTGKTSQVIINTHKNSKKQQES